MTKAVTTRRGFLGSAAAWAASAVASCRLLGAESLSSKGNKAGDRVALKIKDVA